MTNKTLVALLPFKANSERVPGKNFRLFCGKPLFRWMLDKLLSISEISKIVINTDAVNLLATFDVSSNERILIRDRRKDLCGDFVSMNEIIADDLQAISADIYLMTHTTNPLLSVRSIRNALEKFQQTYDQQVDSLFSVTRYQTRFYKANGAPVNHDPHNLIRTQDLEPWFAENSNFYLFSRESFLGRSNRIGTHPIMYETSLTESIDIDTLDDWELAEIVAEGLIRRNRL